MYKKVLLALASVIAITTMAVPANAATTPVIPSISAAAWWHWALETPAATNPVLDTTGARCGVNQAGPIFFLAGTFGGDAERTCTISSSKTLFFPIVNSSYGAFLNDPWNTRTVDYARTQAAAGLAGATFAVKLDGATVPTVHEKSIPTFIKLPEDNVFGATEADIPGLLLIPFVDEGDYATLSNLSKGAHTLVFSNATSNGAIHVTYHLNIV